MEDGHKGKDLPKEVFESGENCPGDDRISGTAKQKGVETQWNKVINNYIHYSTHYFNALTFAKALAATIPSLEQFLEVEEEG